MPSESANHDGPRGAWDGEGGPQTSESDMVGPGRAGARAARRRREGACSVVRRADGAGVGHFWPRPQWSALVATGVAASHSRPGGPAPAPVPAAPGAMAVELLCGCPDTPPGTSSAGQPERQPARCPTGSRGARALCAESAHAWICFTPRATAPRAAFKISNAALHMHIRKIKTQTFQRGHTIPPHLHRHSMCLALPSPRNLEYLAVLTASKCFKTNGLW